MAKSPCSNICYTIPDGITNIGNEAFSWCSKLEEVTIPNSVTKIKDKVFYLCYNLKTVTLSENLESIGEGAFNSCCLNFVIMPSGDFQTVHGTV